MFSVFLKYFSALRIKSFLFLFGGFLILDFDDELELEFFKLFFINPSNIVVRLVTTSVSDLISSETSFLHF